LVTALGLERQTGAPAGWLLDEAAAGRIPYLRAGNRYLFDLSVVEPLLRSRAAGETTEPRPARKEGGHDAAASR